MIKLFGHLNVVTKHRFEVFKNCCKCGLVWRGLMHDLSKFSWVEFSESVKYFTNGKGSPISECKRVNGYSLAWLHHIHRNKHHIEFWYDAGNKEQMNMPYKYAVESVCDKIAATKVYNGKHYKSEMVLEHWLRVGIKANTNDNMREFFTKVFTDLIELGERGVLNKKYMRDTYNQIVWRTNEKII